MSFSEILNKYHRIQEKSHFSDKLLPQVIGLQEDHNEIEDQQKNALLIDQLFRPGDVVLVESPALGRLDQRVESQTRFVKKDIYVAGWDSANGIEAIFDLGRRVHQLLTEYENLLTANINDDSIRIGALKIASLFAEDPLFKLLCEKRKYDESEIRWIKRQSLGNIKQFAMEKWNCLARYDRTRNLSLVKNIEKYLTTSNRVFIIAGKAHFGGGMSDKDPNTEVVYSYLKDKRFNILSPNDERLPVKKISCVIIILKTIWRTVSSCFSCCNRKTKTVGFNPHPAHWMNRITNLEVRKK